MGRIIPGVQVTVVKDVLPQQLAPSGILGVIGFTEAGAEGDAPVVHRAASWNALRAACGPASALSMQAARQALDNGVSELVVVSLPHSAGTTATAPITAVGEGDPPPAFVLSARAPGPWAGEFAVDITTVKAGVFDLRVVRAAAPNEEVEVYRNLDVVADSPRNVAAALARSLLVRISSEGAPTLPADGRYPLAGGADGNEAAYAAGLNLLTDEADVDLVVAALQDLSSSARVTKVYSDIIGHCSNMNDDCKGRLGLGQLPPGLTAEQATELATALVSDRFVLVAPEGVVGAVAGRVGNLPYFHSPTFKRLAGLGALPSLSLERQRGLLRANIVPVALQRGKGTIIIRGLTTDGDQISVRRVADRAVRTMKMIGDLFIGRLNNEDGRNALKQKLTEALLQMEKSGALVPSTDGSDPAFKVDVYSSQQDFALGIVRVDMAVRPVRAIDYIYATIQVQV